MERGCIVQVSCVLVLICLKLTWFVPKYSVLFIHNLSRNITGDTLPSKHLFNSVCYQGPHLQHRSTSTKEWIKSHVESFMLGELLILLQTGFELQKTIPKDKADHREIGKTKYTVSMSARNSEHYFTFQCLLNVHYSPTHLLMFESMLSLWTIDTLL